MCLKDKTASAAVEHGASPQCFHASVANDGPKRFRGPTPEGMKVGMGPRSTEK